MKPYLYIVALLSLIACEKTLNSPTRFQTELAAEEGAETVALLDQNRVMMCAGVWVGPHLILSAQHCLDRFDQTSGPAHVEIQLREGGDAFESTVIAVDAPHDLSLLFVKYPTLHPIAVVARSAPLVGEPVHMVGHPGFYLWTHTNGWVAAVRAQVTPDKAQRSGPWIQIQSPIWAGNSGGGAFDAQGNLCGIASSRAPDVPDTGFYVHADTIREFLKESGKMDSLQ